MRPVVSGNCPRDVARAAGARATALSSQCLFGIRKPAEARYPNPHEDDVTEIPADEELQSRIYNAFNPLDAAGSAVYCDMSTARGTDGALVRDFQRNIRLAGTNYIRFLFSGHIGSGKSSELEQLRQNLLARGPGGGRYFPVVIDTNDYIDDYDADAIDLLLAVVAETAARLREELQINLSDTYFQKRFAELKSFLLSDVELTEGEVTLGNAKLKLRRLKADETARNKVREALRPQVSTILAEINLLLAQVRKQLTSSQTGYDDVVLIIDNLEKIRKVANAAEGFASHKELFLEQYTKLTGFDAHVIYTVPLRLVRSADAPQLNLRYDSIFVLPAVKIRERDGRPFPGGTAALQSLVERRVAPRPLADVIAADALDFLIGCSGGHVRHLMIFMRAATAAVDTLPIDLRAARKAVRQVVATYSVSITEEQWEKLIAVHRSKDQKIANGDAAYLALLENAAILEYRDSDAENEFEAAEPWYAVHPLVRELSKFKERMAESAGAK